MLSLTSPTPLLAPDTNAMRTYFVPAPKCQGLQVGTVLFKSIIMPCLALIPRFRLGKQLKPVSSPEREAFNQA
jgi:hypothetical protein